MRERAKELKAEAAKADGEKALLAKVAEMSGSDRVMAERLHAIVMAAAPHLTPKTWYGMPAWAKDGKVLCTYGGKAESKLDGSADYLMWAQTEYWTEMGKGAYGPMRAMMFGRLSFDGPMGEAMGNMGPFESFLLLVGKVPGDTASCPQ